MYLSRVCTALRQKDSTLKTQLRFHHNDVDVLTKSKGSQEPFRSVPLTQLVDLRDLPPFDHSRRWTHRTDRPPRRKVDYSTSCEDPSNRKQNLQPPTRQSSLGVTPSKKHKKNVEKSSSSSSSSSSDEDMSQADPLDISQIPATEQQQQQTN